MLNKKVILIIFLISGSIALTKITSAGNAILSWDPPTTNTDGSALTDLGGYVVYYGTSSGLYENISDIGSVTTWTVPGLTEGKVYYFAVTAYDTSGNESDFSNEVSKTIYGLPAGNIDTVTPGSVNRVDGYDLISLELSLGTTPLSVNWNPFADLERNGIENGIINQQDLNILIENFGSVQ